MLAIWIKIILKKSLVFHDSNLIQKEGELHEMAVRQKELPFQAADQAPLVSPLTAAQAD